jgi:serine/threonine protein kinase
MGMATAAEELIGLTLPNGWLVVEKLPPATKGSVGYFSVGYIVKSAVDGRPGFLKALDYARILAGADPAAVMLEQTKAFTFERDLLRICRDRRLDRIVEVIDEGSIQPAGRGPTEIVQYLIFELADGDARRQSDLTNRYDMAWALRALHHVATGLSQLHGHQIAHQDTKPSNVLTFGSALSKIGDLAGRLHRAIYHPMTITSLQGTHPTHHPNASMAPRPSTGTPGVSVATSICSAVSSPPSFLVPPSHLWCRSGLIQTIGRLPGGGTMPMCSPTCDEQQTKSSVRFGRSLASDCQLSCAAGLSARSTNFVSRTTPAGATPLISG